MPDGGRRILRRLEARGGTDVEAVRGDHERHVTALFLHLRAKAEAGHVVAPPGRKRPQSPFRSRGHRPRFNPIHVDDAARATIAAQELDGAHTINVAGPETVSIRQVCELAGEAMGESPRFSVDSESRSPLLVADVRRMEALLGPAKVRFKDAISELL